MTLKINFIMLFLSFKNKPSAKLNGDLAQKKERNVKKETALLGLLIGFLVPSILFADGSRVVGSTLYGQSDIYWLKIPAGWSVDTNYQYADAGINSPGGKGRGGMWVGLVPSKSNNLEDEVNAKTQNSNVTSRRRITVAGKSCIHVTTSGRVPGNSVFCQITVPFQDGDELLTLFIGQVMHPDERYVQEQVFWQVIQSLELAPDIK